MPDTPGSLALEQMQKRSRAEATASIVARSRELKIEIPGYIVFKICRWIGCLDSARDNTVFEE
jgi:hypothetical protein